MNFRVSDSARAAPDAPLSGDPAADRRRQHVRVLQSAPAIPSGAVTAVSGRLAQMACAVAVAPFAILTVLFLGGDPT